MLPLKVAVRKSTPLAVFLLVILGHLAAVCPAVAGTQDWAKVALHARPSTKASYACSESDPVSEGIPCQAFTVSHVPLDTGQFVYLVVGQASGAGVMGLSCGIRYDEAVSVQAWYLCAGSEYTLNDWPASGGGSRILWSECQQTVLGSDGVHAVGGAMYVYAYGSGILEVTPNFGLPPEAEFKVTDCYLNESDVLTRGGFVGFGDEFGFTPCWIIDGGCDFGPYGPRRCCCKPGSSENIYWLSSREQFCEHEGGLIRTGPCESTCEEICETTGVAASRSATWGRIKARY